MGQQSNWRYCKKCKAMYYAGYQGGVCSAGGTHSAEGFNYNLPCDVAATGNAQGNWRFCVKCNVMFFNGYSGGKCAAGGTHQAQGLMFVLPHDVFWDVDATPSTQKNWRFCLTCNALFFTGNFGGNGGGNCPAGGAHSAQGFNFMLNFSEAPPTLLPVVSAYTLIIGINPSSTNKSDEIDTTENPGHTIVVFRDSSGKYVKVFSYGPQKHPGIGNIACSGPGKTGYHLLAKDEYKLYEWPITTDQYKRAETKMRQFDINPGTFSGTNQCTTMALEVVEAAGVAAPKGTGDIYIPMCKNAIGVSAPVFLDRELEKQFLAKGKKVVRVWGSEFKGLVEVN